VPSDGQQAGGTHRRHGSNGWGGRGALLALLTEGLFALAERFAVPRPEAGASRFEGREGRAVSARQRGIDKRSPTTAGRSVSMTLKRRHPPEFGASLVVPPATLPKLVEGVSVSKTLALDVGRLQLPEGIFTGFLG
jgi:hypothetical protein